MYATIITNRIAVAPAIETDACVDTRLDIGTDLDVDQAFNELVAPVEVRRPQARCADGNGTLTHLFFSDDALSTARAKAICGKCKLAESCLEGALARAEPWGVWGGELVENGRVVMNKRPRGRPPKHPRPVVEIDEVPIPPHLVA
jgi:hypothetical protein